MTPIAWVISITDMPRRCLSSPQIEHLRLDGHVERGGRSSAMSSFGLHDSAIAIMTRCRMPPENWCG